MLRILTVGLLMLASFSAHADFIGLFAGAGMWRTDFSGNAIAGVDLDGELNLRGDSNTYFYVAIEHPVPILPNLKVAHTSIDDSGTGTVMSNFVYDGQTFTANQTVNSNLDLTHTDATLYYEIVDVGADLDLGVTLRYFDGGLRIDNAFQEIKGAVPMLYVRGKLGLPFTGTYIGGEVNAVSYSGNKLSDYALTVGWETENFILPEFGVEAGYRRMTLDVDQNDLDVNVDADLDGFFVNITAHF